MDISEVGLRQLASVADSEDLAVRVVEADIVEFKTEEEFDVVILDRVLHMLPAQKDRLTVLRTSVGATAVGGFVLIADTPSVLPAVRSFFESEVPPWAISTPSKGLLFAARLGA